MCCHLAIWLPEASTTTRRIDFGSVSMGSSSAHNIMLYYRKQQCRFERRPRDDASLLATETSTCKYLVDQDDSARYGYRGNRIGGDTPGREGHYAAEKDITANAINCQTAVRRGIIQACPIRKTASALGQLLRLYLALHSMLRYTTCIFVSRSRYPRPFIY